MTLAAVILISFTWGGQLQQSVGQTTANQYLSRGLQAEEAGEYAAAMRLWEEALFELSVPSTEIGTEYIRLVTEQQFQDYYVLADSLYKWALSDEAMIDENYPALQVELSRLEPLVEPERFDLWQGLMDQRDPVLLEQIRTFWELLDPLPGNSFNIRLLEHWERIAYARENYTRSEDPPYGTDDRGWYYVAYGGPETTDIDTLMLNTLQVRRVMTHVFGTPPHLTSVLDPMMTVIEHYIDRKSLFFELWIYDKPEEKMLDNFILMFGENTDGEYGRLFTLTDFIPPELFRPIPIPGLPPVPPPSIFLQWLFYDLMSGKDEFFAYMNSDINVKITGSTSLGLSMATAYKLQSDTYWHTSESVEEAPNEMSTEEKKLPGIPLEIHQYRILDEQNQPALLSFVESYPALAFEYDLTANRDLLDRYEAEQVDAQEVLNNYTLIHGMRLGDENGRLVSKATHMPTLFVDFEEEIPSTSVFTLPFISEGASQIFNVQLENHDSDSKPRTESLFPKSVRGFGKTEIPQPESLPKTDDLLMSDLILGFQRETSPPAGAYLPFLVSNKRQIPENENLAIHFEVYNLQPDSTGIASFEVDYEISSVRRVLLWEQVQDQNETSITLNFQTDTDRFEESVEIQTQALEPGNYELLWAVRDLNSGQTTAREIRFEVTKAEEEVVSSE